MSDVFLSYSRDDEAVARRVAKALEAAGHRVWWDSHLPAHRAYADEIESRLGQAKAVVVLWSRSAAQSQWVRAEADFARSAGKLVQAQLDDSLPPMPFNQIQSASLKGWKGKLAHPGWQKLAASVAALVDGEPVAVRPTAPRRWPLAPHKRWVVAAGTLLLLVAAGFAAMRWFGGGDDRKPRVAILPFESIDRRDSSLVSGIWEDTRQAIGRNPQLTVLGPNTAREIAEKGSGTARKMADYLVEASVRSNGDRIRVSVNLVRTDDGAEIWSNSFDRRLDDVFVLQSEIAAEIEGHVRGRLARRGGVKPETIATSGEVYALYSDARATLRKHDSMFYEQARNQLRQVVKMDPNFAPGWAALSVADQVYGPSVTEDRIDFAPQLAEAHARRAIALAPNLAAGYSALGLAIRRGPTAEAALQKAIALDPSDFESVTWLANLYKGKDETTKALQLYTRAVEIEPLYWPAVLSKLDLLLDHGDNAAAEHERQRLDALGNPLLSALAGIEIARSQGDLSKAATIGLAVLHRNPPQNRGIVGYPLYTILLQLGLVDEAHRAFPPPPFGPPLSRNDPRGLDMVEKLGMSPQQFFALHPLPMNAARVYLLTGRGRTLATLYKRAASSPQQFLAICGSDIDYVMIAPFIAIALRQAGDEDEARRVLVTAEGILNSVTLDRRSNQLALLARVHAAQGRKAEALAELDDAVGHGWLPTIPEMANDIAFDPAFDSIKADPRFDASRRQIFGHIARERSELGPVKLD